MQAPKSLLILAPSELVTLKLDSLYGTVKSGSAMQEPNTKEGDRSYTTLVSAPPQSMSCGTPPVIPSPSSTLLTQDADFLAGLSEQQCSYVWRLALSERTPKGVRLSGECRQCGEQVWKWLHNVKRMVSVQCRNCVASKGHYKDKRSSMLGVRYHAMRQRCDTWTHVSSHNYRGRGIKVEFKRREFIMWALAQWPEETFLNKDFDRIDNDGHYSFENLRLVSRSENLKNTRLSDGSLESQAITFMAEHPGFPMTARHVRNLLQQGCVWREIESKATSSSRRNLTKRARQEKLEKASGKADAFFKSHPEAKLRHDYVVKLLKQGVSRAQIRAVDLWARGIDSLESLPQTVAVLVCYPFLNYSRDYVGELLAKGWTPAQMLEHQANVSMSMQARAMQWVNRYPDTYSVATFWALLKDGKTETQILQRLQKKFRLSTSTTSSTLDLASALP